MLIGNPNVGKSALFSHMTGITVKTSNYAGTTVSYTQGSWQLPQDACVNGCASCTQITNCKPNKKKALKSNSTIVDLIDVPGTYSLNPLAVSEEIAVKMIDEGDIIINVIDATNLERNLSLTLDLFRYQKPMIIALNMWDETAHLGINIDINKLEKELGVPIVTTNGRSGNGVIGLGRRLKEAKIPKQIKKDDKWNFIGKIVDSVQHLTHRHHTIKDRLQEISIHPIFGMPLAILVLGGMFFFVIVCGGWLNQLLNYLFTIAWVPLMEKLYYSLDSIWLRTILVGSLIDGEIVLETSMGILVSGIFIPIGLVMPYLLLFYLCLGFLEDWGYLPRMAVLFDSFFHKLGLHGYSVIPIMLSTGCNIPGLLALRNLGSRREKYITAVIACTTIPCMAQSALVFSAVMAVGGRYLALVVVSLITTAIILGVVLNTFTKGTTPTLIVEMPPYRLPGLKIQMKKILSRLRGFFIEAVPLMMLGILIIQVLYLAHVIDYLFAIMEPLVVGLWGLPKETASAMLVGLIRKDAAIALLAPLNLEPMQLVTAVVALVLYFPCVATYSVLAKEMGTRDLIKITFIMLGTAIVGGTTLNLLGMFLAPTAIVIMEIVVCVAVLTLYKVKTKRIL